MAASRLTPSRSATTGLLRLYGDPRVAVIGLSPELRETERRRKPGDEPCREGAAVTWAAIDWARVGMRTPTSVDMLRSLWRHYVAGGPAATSASTLGCDGRCAWRPHDTIPSRRSRSREPVEAVWLDSASSATAVAEAAEEEEQHNHDEDDGEHEARPCLSGWWSALYPGLAHGSRALPPGPAAMGGGPALVPEGRRRHGSGRGVADGHGGCRCRAGTGTSVPRPDSSACVLGDARRGRRDSLLACASCLPPRGRRCVAVGGMRLHQGQGSQNEIRR